MELSSLGGLLSPHSRGRLSARHIMSSTSQQDLAADGVFLLLHFVLLIKTWIIEKKKKSTDFFYYYYFIVLFFLMEQPPEK